MERVPYGTAKILAAEGFCNLGVAGDFAFGNREKKIVYGLLKIGRHCFSISKNGFWVYTKGIMDMQKIKIERASENDAEEILALMKIIGSETDNLSFGKEGLPASLAEEKAFLSEVASSEREAFFVARLDGKIVGTAHYTAFKKQRMAHRGEIGICVRKSAWGLGVGSKLMDSLVDFAKNTAKSEIIGLEVRSDNEGAIRLYKRFGFEKIGCFRGFFKIDGKLIDFDLMEKTL